MGCEDEEAIQVRGKGIGGFNLWLKYYFRSEQLTCLIYRLHVLLVKMAKLANLAI